MTKRSFPTASGGDLEVGGVRFEFNNGRCLEGGVPIDPFIFVLL